MISALGMHHDGTARHCMRVMRLAKRVAHAYRTTWLDHEMEALLVGAMLHDVGKLAVPVSVLTKPGKLGSEDWPIIHAHPLKGAALLAMIPELEAAIPAVRNHHERWDGLGYPDGLSAQGIPLHARIVAVCDTYDAITHDRPYREARDHKQACEILEKAGGMAFDPAVVRALTGFTAEELRDR